MKYKLLFGVYFLLAIVLFPFYQYRINPDAISYFNIAHSYIVGTNFINGFWSPLLSWLLVPFLFFHIKAVFAFNIIQLIFGFLTLIAIIRIARKLSIPENVRFLSVIFSLPLILFSVYSGVVTPDLLSLCLILFYFDTVLSKKVNGVLAGVYGALAYFAKTYSLFFFVIHFVLLMLYKRDRRSLIKGLLICFIIILPWVTTLTAKYHYFTVGNAGAYNFQVSRPGGVDDPHFYDGLIKPEPNATSSWYDPSYLQIAYHKPTSLTSEITGWTAVIAKNVATLIYNYEGFVIFAFIVLLYYALKIKKSNSLILLFTFLLFSAGYSLYHIEDRYIWFGVIILLLMVADMKVKNVYLFIMLLSFTVLPMKRLVSNLYFQRDIYVLSKNLQIKGNIASNQEWNNSLYIAYYNNSKYYGIVKGDNQQVLYELKNNSINYFLVWNDGVKYKFLSALKPTQIEKNFSVYKIN